MSVQSLQVENAALSETAMRVTNEEVVLIELKLARMISEIHQVVVKQPVSRLASLSQTERDLYDATSETEAFGARELCQRTGVHDLNSRTKQCLSNLVKLELLRKAHGRKGYLRTPAKS